MSDTDYCNYARDFLERVAIARRAVDHALGGISRLSPDEVQHLGDDYLARLFDAQDALTKARAALLAPLTPNDAAMIVREVGSRA